MYAQSVFHWYLYTWRSKRSKQKIVKKTCLNLLHCVRFSNAFFLIPTSGTFEQIECSLLLRFFKFWNGHPQANPQNFPPFSYQVYVLMGNTSGINYFCIFMIFNTPWYSFPNLTAMDPVPEISKLDSGLLLLFCCFFKWKNTSDIEESII